MRKPCPLLALRLRDRLALPLVMTVRQPAFGPGRAALALQDRQADPERPPRALIIATELPIRRSIAPPRTAITSPVVAAAT